MLQQTLCKDPKHLQTNRALENDTVLHSMILAVEPLMSDIECIAQAEWDVSIV